MFPIGQSFFILSIKSSRQFDKNVYPTILYTSKLPSRLYNQVPPTDEDFRKGIKAENFNCKKIIFLL